MVTLPERPDALPRIGHRYALRDTIGRGAMGTVYRAYDRLTGQIVALKRVELSAQVVSRFAPHTHSSADFRLMLANEFRTLASLRHPNIITVLDYGFDAQGQPYFTMELLEATQTIVQAGRGQPLAVQFDLLVQMLQAVAYLHRRGIVHRDLKPDNLRVLDGRVKVLDFGIAVTREHVNGERNQLSGTLAYLAPEILLGDPASEASDLYAVGLIAYELLAGSHPFSTEDLNELLLQALTSTPDVQRLGIDAQMKAILDGLLARHPDDRFQNAYDVIVALCGAVGRPIPFETAAIRDSYLQAATFVGRDAELRQLTAALTAALHGAGSAWLVGGESGVGKSRLLDELRSQALVDGAVVVRGHSRREGGPTYQLWRELLRPLLLNTTLSRLESGVLKDIIPDLDALLADPDEGPQPLPDPPELPSKPRQDRLVQTIIAVLSRQPAPVVLLLEDLQWEADHARESLATLTALTQAVDQLPLLLVGSYRDDERPDLPDTLAGMTLLKLHRLDDSAIARLSASMLGKAGRNSDVLDLLYRETEGNAFFLVEVARALAEEAGRIDDIEFITLPTRIVAGGIRQVTRRRLSRVPERARLLLKLAAVAGLHIDVKVLRAAGAAAGSTMTLEDWLTACSDAAVLEVFDGRWRFSHEKLREALIADLEAAERQSLHRQVAQAIEVVYPGGEGWADVLVEHWHAAGDTVREAQYAYRSAVEAFDVAMYENALIMGERALNLFPADNPPREKIRLLRVMGESATGAGDYANANRHLAQSLQLARERGDKPGRAAALRALGINALDRGEWETARAHLEESLIIARRSQLKAEIARTLAKLGWLSALRGDLNSAQAYARESLALGHELNDGRVTAESLFTLGGRLAVTQGDPREARHYLEDSLLLARTIGDRWTMANALHNLGFALAWLGDQEAARRHYYESLTLAQMSGDRWLMSANLSNLGFIALQRSIPDSAREYLRGALWLAQDIGALPRTLNALAGFAWHALLVGQAERGAELLGLVLAHPASETWLLELCDADLCPRFAAVLPAADFAAARTRGAGLLLDGVLATLI
ncbi:MAG: AAA family ATPase [Chloroflexi bacterium]|nr:AAA family ATPase [Chloroflexota bacterium]